MKLSGRTRAELIEAAAEGYSHDGLDVLFLRLGLEGDLQLDHVGGRTKLKRVQRAVTLLENEERTIDLVRELIEVKFASGAGIYFSPGPPSRLVESLRLDGIEVIDGRLVVATPEPASVAHEMSIIEERLEESGFSTALAHYQQAVDSFVDGRLEASNGQLRSALEALLREMYLRATGQDVADPRGAIDRLRSANYLDGDEAKLLQGLVGISNANGAHAGLSHSEEALFRLHFTTAAIRYLLVRVDLPVDRH